MIQNEFSIDTNLTKETTKRMGRNGNLLPQFCGLARPQLICDLGNLKPKGSGKNI